MERSWDVLIIGGPSGAGKSSVAYPLAQKHGTVLTEIDDLHLAVLALTTSEQQPILHYWTTHPEAVELPPEEILELFIKVCRVMTPAIHAAIWNHIETAMPVVMEGDYVVPEALAEAMAKDGRVRGVFLYEPDEGQLLRNYAAREPGGGQQEKRSRVSALHGEWLKSECERLGLPALPARPWETLAERIEAAVG